MTSAVPVIMLSPRDYDAVLFDLDGVLELALTADNWSAIRRELVEEGPGGS